MSEAADACPKRPIQCTMVREISLLIDRPPTDLSAKPLRNTINSFSGNLFTDASSNRLFVRPLQQSTSGGSLRT